MASSNRMVEISIYNLFSLLQVTKKCSTYSSTRLYVVPLKLNESAFVGHYSKQNFKRPLVLIFSSDFAVCILLQM